MVHKINSLTRVFSLISRLDWLNAIENMKKHCSNITFGLIEELERRFLV